jgi:hypothetical protein
MKEITNECVGCPSEMGCLGNSCPNRNVERYYCDVCGEELDDEIYEVDGEDLCIECLKERFRKEDI